MKTLIFLLLLVVQGALAAENDVQSDCKRSELKALRAKPLLQQFSADTKVMTMDCTVIRPKSGAEKLLVIYDLAEGDAVETHLAVVNRENPAKFLYKSESLGFGSMEIKVKTRTRLVFLQSAESNKIEFYTNTQTGANETRFFKRELNLSSQDLKEVPDHSWPTGTGNVPRVYMEKSKWRAIMHGKIVDL